MAKRAMTTVSSVKKIALLPTLGQVSQFTTAILLLLYLVGFFFGCIDAQYRDQRYSEIRDSSRQLAWGRSKITMKIA